MYPTLLHLAGVISVLILSAITPGEAVLCSSLPYQSCPAGTFLLRDLQSQLPGGDCSCVPCLPGSYRYNLSVDICEACGGYDKYCASPSSGKVSRSSGMCTLFSTTNANGVFGMFQSYANDKAYVIVNSNRIAVSDYLQQMGNYFYGDMQDFRNAQAPCGNLTFTNNQRTITLSAGMPKPGITTLSFAIKNSGGLPSNITFTPTQFASILSSSYQQISSAVLAQNTTTTFFLSIDTSQVSPDYEFANRSGFSYNFGFENYPYWIQQAPKQDDPYLNLTMNVNYVQSALYVTPSQASFDLNSGDQDSTQITLFNLAPARANYSVMINYDNPSYPFILPMDRGILNGSSQCKSNIPVFVPVSEYSTQLSVNVDTTNLFAGTYGAVVVISSPPDQALFRVTLNVDAGYVQSGNYLLSFDDDSVLDNVTASTLVSFSAVPQDYLNQTTFEFSDVDPNSLTFTATLTPLFDCDSCFQSLTGDWWPGTGFHMSFEASEPGEYTLEVYDDYGDEIIGSPVNLTITPVDCASNDGNSYYSTDVGACVCNPGFGVAFHQMPFVLCVACPAGTYSTSSGDCSQCPVGTYSGSSESSFCITCEEATNTTMWVSNPVLKPIKVNDSVDLSVDPLDSVPSSSQDSCVLCPANSKANIDIGVCLPCPLGTKLRKVVDDILYTNDTSAFVSWRYDCVCQASYYKADNGSCLPCPTGGYCLGRTENTILPLQGYWQSPWSSPGQALQKCSQTSSCPGVYLDPSVSQQTDAYYAQQELAYLSALNTTLTLLQAEQGNCTITLVCSDGFTGPLCKNCATGFTTLGSSGCTQCIPQGAMIFVIAAGIVAALIITAFIVVRTIRVATDEMEYIGQTIKSAQLSKSDVNVSVTPRAISTSEPSANHPQSDRVLPVQLGNPERAASSDAMGDSQSQIIGYDAQGAPVKAKGSAEEVVVAKILISHLQEISMAAAFSLSWPDFVTQMFYVFNVLSSAGQTLFSLSCLLAPARSSSTQVEVGGACLNTTAVSSLGLFDPTRPQTFFIEGIFYATIPFAWAVLTGIFWYIWYWRTRILTQRRRGKASWNFFLLTLIVLTFLLYPTLSRTALRFFSCGSSVSGYSFLNADYNVVCMGKTHVAWMATLGVFMLVVFAFGIPAGIFYILWKHHRKLSKYKPVFGFIYLGYQRRFYYWECVIMVRKFLFSVCAVIIGPLGADVQAYVALMILMLFLQLQITFMPYDAVLLNRCEIAGLVIRFLTIMFGLFVSSASLSLTAQYIFAALIVIMNAAFIIFAFWAITRAANAIRRNGILVAFGLAVARDAKEASGATHNFFSKTRSAIPTVHHLFPGKSTSDNQLQVFSDPQQSVRVDKDQEVPQPVETVGGARGN